MLTALKSYLQAQGCTNIYCDYMPDAAQHPQAINLTKWDHTTGVVCDGSGTHYIQVQCRDVTYDAAYATCKSIFALLDSGTEETLIPLTEEVYCIARPRRGPLILERGSGCTTIYCESSLWGKN